MAEPFAWTSSLPRSQAGDRKGWAILPLQGTSSFGTLPSQASDVDRIAPSSDNHLSIVPEKR